MNPSLTIEGRLVDIKAREIYPAKLVISEGKIQSITRLESGEGKFILPGFIDSHVHIESSMLVPAEFARLAVVHGTVATVSDPHEIANVCGLKGVTFMIDNGKTVPFKFNFGAPSCVPATIFETAGDQLNADDVASLLQRDDIKYLSEMMNFPGVLHADPEVMKKISTALELGKPVDGRAPGLRGKQARDYCMAGAETINITTDHECFAADEALDKIKCGMKILIREGSAAKNFDALIDLLHDYPEQIMFCSDDKHPDSLVIGHINQLCSRAVKKGIDIFNVLMAACVNPVEHYKLDVGLLQQGDAADLILVDDLVDFTVQQTYINGELVAEKGTSKINTHLAELLNQFQCAPKKDTDFQKAYRGEKRIPVIEALDGQLITNRLELKPLVINNLIESDTSRDILKIVVVNRYKPAPVAIAFIKNFGLKKGALASSVAHDSHNIVAVGAEDSSICKAVNAVIDSKGGISAVSDTRTECLALPVAGLMTNKDGYEVAAEYALIDRMTREELGSTLLSPFMTLSFMALLVIPALKLSDKGLFDGQKFQFVE